MWPCKHSSAPKIVLSQREFTWKKSDSSWVCRSFRDDVDLSLTVDVLHPDEIECIIQQEVETIEHHNDSNINDLKESTKIPVQFRLEHIRVWNENGRLVIGLYYEVYKESCDTWWCYKYDTCGSFIEVDSGD